MALSLSSTFTGRVASVNEKGIRLDGHTDWLNFSKFAEDLVAPDRGQCVTVTVDRQGFIRSVQNAEAGPGAVPGQNGRSEPASGQNTAMPTHDRDRTITRLAVLKAAAEYAASKPESKSTDVLKIAESWERWVNRSDEPGQDLVDAF